MRIVDSSSQYTLEYMILISIVEQNVRGGLEGPEIKLTENRECRTLPSRFSAVPYNGSGEFPKVIFSAFMLTPNSTKTTRINTEVL